MGGTSPYVLVHAGFASDKRWHVEGYVIEKLKYKINKQNRRHFTPINLYRSYTNAPIEGVNLEVELGGQRYSTQTDRLGYFSFEEEHDGNCPQELEIVLPGITKHTAQLDVIHDGQTIVVSDLDDTILVSHARTMFRKLFLLLFYRTKDRRQVKDMSVFYNSLQQNQEAHFFYLTNSEWNLYPIINYFLQQEGFPEGSMLMNWLKPHLRKIRLRNKLHKQDYLDVLARFFPNNKFILIGDTGQNDPYVYQEFTLAYPDLVKSIGFRKVTSGMSKKRLKAMFQSFEDKGGVVNVFRKGTNLKDLRW